MKTGKRKQGDFETLKKLCKKHFNDYLFQKVRHSSLLDDDGITENKFNLGVMEHFFLRYTKDSNMSPQNFASCVTDLETLFDMLVTAYYFLNEYLGAEEKEKRLFFFELQINECLEGYGYEMKEGIIRHLPEDGMRQLVEEVVEYGVIESDESKIQHAIDLFFKRNATNEDKRSAIKSLGDLLESVRDKLKSESQLKEDENDIFNILNTHGIRHHNSDQQKLEEPYLAWTFYLLLNTVKTFIKLK